MENVKETKRPDYLTLALIALLLMVFAGGQWIVVQLMDARVAALESSVVGAVDQNAGELHRDIIVCATKADLQTAMATIAATKAAPVASAATPPAPAPAGGAPAPAAAPHK